jgi:hypothetical protein
MSLTITTEELLQYLYQETNPETTFLIEEALTKDTLLKEKLEALKASVNSLDSVLESPRTETVLNVLRYARETAPAGSR